MLIALVVVPASYGADKAATSAPVDAGATVDGMAENFGSTALDLIRSNSTIEGIRLLSLLAERLEGMDFKEPLERRIKRKPKPLRTGARIEGNLVTREVGALSPALAQKFRAALSHADLARVSSGTKLCGGFQPGVALKFIDGEKTATVMLCFACRDIKVEGTGHYPFDMGGAEPELLRLSVEAFPGDEQLSALLRERLDTKARREKFQASMPPAVFALLAPKDFFASMVSLRPRDISTGQLLHPEIAQPAADDPPALVLKAAAPEILAQAILRALGLQDLDWESIDHAANVLIESARRLGGTRWLAALRQLPEDPAAAAGAARLLLWEGLPVEAEDLNGLMGRIVAAAAARQPGWHNATTVALLASSTHPGVGALLMEMAQERVPAPDPNGYDPSRSALAAIGAALVDPKANGMRLRALRFQDRRDRLAHGVALALLGDTGALPPDVFFDTGNFVRAHALDAIARFDGVDGMEALCTKALDSPYKGVVLVDAIDTFKRIVRDDWPKTEKLGKTDADVRAVRDWWKKRGQAFVEKRKQATTRQQ